jgi:mono/diheme cytochrome c family protein
MLNSNKLTLASLVSGLAFCVLTGNAGEPDISKLPAPAAKTGLTYAKDIQPMLKESCLKCHGEDRPKGKYRVDSREALIKGGSSDEAAVVIGKSEKSPIVHYVADLVEEMEMPPAEKREKYPALKTEQIALLRAWIDQGAK